MVINPLGIYIYIYIPVIPNDGGTTSHFIPSSLTMAHMARGHDIRSTPRLQFTGNRISNLEVGVRPIFQTKHDKTIYIIIYIYHSMG